MATGKVRTRKITKTITTDEPDGVELLLTEEEAKALCAVVGMIGGCPRTTARVHTEKIYDILRDLLKDYKPDYSLLQGSLYFKN